MLNFKLCSSTSSASQETSIDFFISHNSAFTVELVLVSLVVVVAGIKVL